MSSTPSIPSSGSNTNTSRSSSQPMEPVAPPKASTLKKIGARIKDFFAGEIKDSAPKNLGITAGNKQFKVGETFNFRGKELQVTTSEEPLTTAEKVKAAVCLATHAPLAFSAKERHELKNDFNTLRKGTTMKASYKEVAAPDTSAVDGFNKKDQASLIKYINEHKSQCIRKNGHIYFLDDANSGAIIVPKGDLNPETSKIAYWSVVDKKTGLRVEAGQLDRIVSSFCIAQADILKDGEGLNVFIVDVGNEMIRGYKSSFELVNGTLKPRKMGIFSGKWIKLSDDKAWKDIRREFSVNTEEKKDPPPKEAAFPSEKTDEEAPKKELSPQEQAKRAQLVEKMKALMAQQSNQGKEEEENK